ncbi:class E sortase [Cellulomonas aerilata]|uniref:Class E sortase n=1 Tax=Cellulomonas aerilata TaxID=515326 RepID=A0A512D7K7_9CELL|nr:class E sortase [Cellulomonas aerilata]GEO32453.1 class E sortase [Cellulomonas aerilata]
MTATAQGTGTGALAPARHGRAHDLLLGVVGVVGELMITAGVLLGGFIVWQLWWTDVEGDRAQAQAVERLGWEPAPVAAPASAPAAPTVAARETGEPPVPAEPEHATTFATMVVPRWAGEPERPISQGVDRETVLDPLGVGHYPGTAMPGAVGNFSVAAHRTTYGKPFNRVEELVAGDPVVVRTQDTWYVYRVTSTRVVDPSDVSVVAPDPVDPQAQPTQRTMTMTTCHPMFSARERYVVHLALDYWAPTSGPAPVELVGGA